MTHCWPIFVCGTPHIARKSLKGIAQYPLGSSATTLDFSSANVRILGTYGDLTSACLSLIYHSPLYMSPLYRIVQPSTTLTLDVPYLF